jgi:H+-transporting ATPase
MKKKAKPLAPAPQDDLKTLPMAEVEKKLESSPDGLTDAEAKKRLTQYGPNELLEKKTNLLLKFLSYFWGPIPWMIEIAVILSGVVRHWPDFFIILVLLVTNAVVAFWEERQAGNEIAGDQGPRDSRRQMDQPAGARAGAGRRHPPAVGRRGAGRRTFADR